MNTQEKRRCSILKKRRSRSLSPRSPTREHTARRASRRISFSGKHNVREFFTNENTAIVWGETYDVSTEKHVLSNEQITLQSTRSSSMSTTLQVTRNESTVMDISSAPIVTVNEKPLIAARPLNLRQNQPYSEDQKENILLVNDTEMELSLVMQPPAKTAPRQSLFTAPLRRPSLFNFTHKNEASILAPAEKTSGSDNMDISGIEPTLPSSELPMQTVNAGNNYRDWLKQNNLIAKPKDNVEEKRRETVCQVMDMYLDKSQSTEVVPMIKKNELQQKPVARRTINEQFEMSMDNDTATKSNAHPKPVDEKRTAEVVRGNSRRQTINQAQEMQLDMSPVSESPIVQHNLAWKPNSQPNKCLTVNQPAEMSLENRSGSNCDHLVDMSIEIMQSEVKGVKGNPSLRQSMHQIQDISMDVPMSAGNRQVQNKAQDISLDTIQWTNPPYIQQQNTNQKKPTQSANRMTINEPREMSFDSTSKTTAQTFSNKTNLGDISMDLQLTEPYKLKFNPPHVQRDVANYKKSSQSSARMTINEPREMSFDSTAKSTTKTFSNKTILDNMSMDFQTFEAHKQPTRKSVIHKSPSKNATTLFDQSESFEMTKAIDQNSMYLSYHPLHSTKLNEVNCSKFPDIDFDTSIQTDKTENNTLHSASMIEETFVDENKATQSAANNVPAKSVQLFNQTKNQSIRGVYDLDMSNDSPIPTAKKYNLNKTPFYFGIDKENDPALIETMHASGSSLDITNNSGDEQMRDADRKSGAQDLRRGTVLLHATIQNETNTTTAANGNNTMTIEISDTSIELPHTDAPTMFSNMGNSRRKTCVEEMPMVLQPIQKANERKASNIMTQSILQITPIKIDDSINEKLPNPDSQRDKENKRLTTIRNETIALDDSPIGNASVSFGLEGSKQLTFIDDDDEDDQICNTKLDLAISLDGSLGSDINDLVHRKNASFDRRSVDISKFSLASMNSEHMYELKDAAQELAEQNPPPLPSAMTLNELEAFKKSNRLRHSNVFDINVSTETNPNETAPDDEVFRPVHKKDASPDNRISMGPVGRSSILLRRSSIGSNHDANETSFLSKSVANKPLNELKLNFSGYDQFIGLATPQDVFNDFCNRMNQIQLKAQAWTEERRKLENGEIDSIDVYNNNNDEALVSQNVEAPSWASLYINKIKWEEEQQEAELDRQWEERLIGAFLPAIPDINILVLNKCRVLKNWTFDDIWFFQGNIHLRNIEMPAFKVCLIYDPNMVEKSVNMYGTLKFNKINYQFCPIHLKRRSYAVFKLELLELRSKLPKNLVSLCETSTQLSNFDDKLNEYCINAQNKVKELHELCRKSNAVIKEEEGTIYILKCMLDFEHQIYQDYIIELSDIDCTDWRNVRTNPRRVLNETIRSLPKGMAFIKELLAADSKYVPWG